MNEQINREIEEQEIDLIKLISDLWERRAFIFKRVGIGVIVGLVVAFSIPKEYTSESTLVPEFNSASSRMGAIGGLAMLAGFGSSNLNGVDAISPTLYPDIVGGFPFISDLYDLEVTNVDGDYTTTLYNYIREDQKQAWWGHVIAAPFRLLGAVIGYFSPEKEAVDNSIIDIEKPTLDQYRVYRALSQRISANVDTKTYVITVSTKMQDPQIALDVSKVVLNNLQSYVTNYRTQKAKKDMEYAEMVYNDAELKYYAAQNRYATFEDENKNISSARYRTEQERLRNEMNLAYSIYANLASNLETAKLKVQEQTPVYATIAPASRPTDDSEPNKPMILIAFTFLAGVISSGYLIFRDKLIEF